MVTLAPLALQWGHDFAAVEIVSMLAPVGICTLELQWGHDFAAVEMLLFELLYACKLPSCFNGATTLQPWK